MRRSIYTALAVVLLAAGVWAGGGYMGGGPGVYQVRENPAGTASISLVVERPGLFVDLLVPLGPGPKATVAGKPATLFAPWPGGRQRLFTFWRGPAEIQLFEGTGPFYVENQTRTVHGRPDVAYPQGWRYEGRYVGRLEPLAGAPVPTFVPQGVGSSDMAQRVTKLYEAAAALFQSEPVVQGPIVIPGPNPENAAIAVLNLWFPEYDEDARWWYAGALKFYTVRLLDQTGLWNGTEKSRYQKAQSTDSHYMMVLWLDATIRLDKSARRSLDDVVRPALAVHTNKELLEVIEEKAGLAVSDKIYRMLKGREPKPLTGS